MKLEPTQALKLYYWILSVQQCLSQDPDAGVGPDVMVTSLIWYDIQSR